jgi:hypothetical protein
MLSLNSIINIIVNLPSASTTAENFSLACIISKNTVISTTDRVKIYDGVDAMTAAGFATDSAEVAAAKLYFSQTPTPAKLAVGVQGDSETAVEAITACRAANSTWYLCILIGAVKADILLAAAYVESASPAMVMFYTTADTDALAGTAGNVCLALQTAKYRRTLGQYSNHANAVTAIAGYACGANDGTEAFDLAFKPEVGVPTEALNSSNVSILKGQNCNYYALFNNTYSLFMSGVMADGTHYDEVLGIDMLTADIQTAVMSVLTSLPKVPGTDDGVSLITTAVSGACDTALKRGFIAAGTWTGPVVKSLKAGDALVNGYSVQAGSIDDLSEADRSARKSPPVYVCIILANSLESFTITVNVDR